MKQTLAAHLKLVALGFSVLLNAGVLAPAARAQDPATATPQECRGTDMLAELKSSDPGIFEKINAEANAAINANAIFWKIERTGVAPSYLFGTIHLTDARVVELPQPVKSAIRKSKAVLLEIEDLSPQSSSAGLASAMKLAVFTDGRSLESLVSPDEFEKVRGTLSKAGVPGAAAQFFKPWIVTMLLAASDCERLQIQKGVPVLDARIASMARAEGIAIAGLETVESQLSVLASIPEDQQILMLKSALAYANRTDDLIETTLQLYLKRNMGAAWPLQVALAQKAGFPDTSYAAAHESLIVERNAVMRDGALPYLEKGAAFIAVGALHLPGKRGLVELFRERGYTVTPAE